MISERIVARYAELKLEEPGCVLLMQVGAFMKVLDEDARTVSGVTGLKLLMSGSVEAPVVLGGFPKSGLDAYVGKLVRAGHSVAVAFQDADKKRNMEEVIRVSPGPGGRVVEAERSTADGAVRRVAEPERSRGDGAV